jgi:hypothetical protein
MGSIGFSPYRSALPAAANPMATIKKAELSTFEDKDKKQKDRFNPMADDKGYFEDNKTSFDANA